MLKKKGGKAVINGSAILHLPNRSGSPMITITKPDHGDDDDVDDCESLGRESQQMIVTTSPAPADQRADNQPQQTPRRHQLLLSTAMNGEQSNGRSATTSGSGALVQQNHHLALTYYTHHEHLHPILQQQHERRVSELPSPQYRAPISSPPVSQQDTSNPVYQVPIRARDAIATTLSALYGKLIVVMGIAFPMAEVISTYIPPSFYEVRESAFSYLNPF